MPLQFTLQRRKNVKSGIRRGPERKFPKHEKWVRGFACCVPGCTNRQIDFAHVRSAENSGTGLKPPSSSGVPLCRDHHNEQHRIGQPAFERKYEISLSGIAAELARRTTDRDLREAMKEAER